MAKKKVTLQEEALKKASSSLRSFVEVPRHGHIQVPLEMYAMKSKPTKSYGKIVKPHWNYLAERLNGGQSLDVIRQLDRLKELSDQADNDLTKIKKENDQYGLLLFICTQSSEEYKMEETLANSLGNSGIAKESDHYRWYWRVITDFISESSESQQKWSYQPVVSGEFYEEFGVEVLPAYPFSFSGLSTWNDVLSQVSSYQSLKGEELQRLKNYTQVITFRVSLIEAVLWHFDVFGYVQFYEKLSTPFREEVSRDGLVAEIIRRGLELYKERPSKYKTRDSLVADLADEYGYSDKSSLIGRLKSKGLYPTSGHSSGGISKSEQERLLRDMITVWRDRLSEYDSDNSGTGEDGG